MSDTKRIYRVKLRERIADESAEGRPAYPAFGFRSFGVILIALASVLMLVGVTLAFFVQPIAAAVLVALGLVLLLVNPEVWTALMRGKERENAEHELAYEEVGSG